MSAETLLTMPPTRHAVAMSDAVLPSIAERYESSVRSASKRYCSSSTWPAAQLADRRRQQRGDVGAERRGERRRLREQVVAGEDRDDVRPARVHARHAPAGLGLVDHVVVVERPEVHELDRRAAGDGVVGGGPGRAVDRVAPRTGRSVGRRRLPPACEQVAGGLAQEPVVGGHGVAQAGLDRSRSRASGASPTSSRRWLVMVASLRRRWGALGRSPSRSSAG